jgi:NCS1 family nucleobase:cation symporter-1
MVSICIATLATNIAANVVSPANDFSHVWPRIISFRVGGFITGVIGIIMMPWKLIADPHGYIFTWLIAYSALLGAVGGILICDYFALRRTKLSLRDLYDPRGRYSYVNGINWAAIAALVIAVAPTLPGFLHTVKLIGSVPPIWDRIYTYAWFVTFAIAFVIYYVLMFSNRSVQEEINHGHA